MTSFDWLFMNRCRAWNRDMAKNFLELGAYEDAAKCAIKAEGMRFVLGRMPPPTRG